MEYIYFNLNTVGSDVEQITNQLTSQRFFTLGVFPLNELIHYRRLIVPSLRSIDVQ